MTLYYCRDIER